MADIDWDSGVIEAPKKTAGGEVDWDSGVISKSKESSLLDKPKESSLLDKTKSAAYEVVIGTAGAMKAFSDAFGAGNEVSRSLGNVIDDYRAGQTPERKAELQAQAARTAAAEQSGSVLEEAKAAGTNFIESPGSFVLNAFGSVVPAAAGAMLAPVVGVSGTVAAGAMGAGMGAGAVKGAIYDDQVKRGREAGLSREEAEVKATEAQAYDGKNVDQIAIGAGLGVLAGTTGVEKVLTGGGTSAIKSAVGRTLAGSVAEAVPEAAQGGQEKLAANLAAQREGADVPTWQGVVGQAAAEGLASTGPGAVAGASTRYVPENGPLSRGANTGIDTNAAEQVAAASGAQQPEGATPLTAAAAKAGPAQPDADTDQAIAALERQALAQDVQGRTAAIDARVAEIAATGTADSAAAQELANLQAERAQITAEAQAHPPAAVATTPMQAAPAAAQETAVQPPAAPAVASAQPAPEVAPQASQAPQAATPEPAADPRTRWAEMPVEQRQAVVAQMDGLSDAQRQNLPRAHWGYLNAAMRDRLAQAMAPQPATAQPTGGMQDDGTGTFQRTDAALAAPGNSQAGLDLGRGPADTPRQPDGGQQPAMGADAGTPLAGSGAAEPAGVAGAGRAEVAPAAPAATVSPITGEMQPNETQRAEVAGEAAPPGGTQAAPAVEPIEVRAGRVIDDLRAMAQDAGWSEVGGRMVRDQDGNVSRTKWIPRAEWFMAGMEGKPDILAQHIEDFAAGKRIPIKSRRTIESMTEWREAQSGGQILAPEDRSYYELDVMDYESRPDRVKQQYDDFDDFTSEAGAPQDTAGQMRALGFTEQEIESELRREVEAGAVVAGERNTGGTPAVGRDDLDPQQGQARAGAAEVRQEGLTLDSYTRDDLAQREAQQQAAADLERRTEQQAAQRAEADAQRADFTLTGSDRDADVAAARGQEGLFDQPAPDDGPRFSRGAATEPGTDQQFRDTERAYGGREAYERAKAAGRTKLNYRQWVQVRTPAFKAWFGNWEALKAQSALDAMQPVQIRVPDEVTLNDGREKAQDSYGRPDQQSADSRLAPLTGLDSFVRQPLRRVNPDAVSKVTNPETGEPMVVYHGTGKDFSEFQEGKRQSQYGGGIYFGKDPKVASSFASPLRGPAPNVMPVYLSLQNPFIETGDYAKTPKVPKLKDQGYDGIIALDGQIVAFDPTQIKSATGNTGDFDGTNPDIRFSRGAGTFSSFKVPAETVTWLGFSGSMSWRADLQALAQRHPEYYDSALEVQQDVEYVMQRPDGWFIHDGQKVMLFREGDGNQIPQVRVELERSGDGLVVRSVYVGNRRQIAKKMQDKREKLVRIGLGGQSLDSLTVAEYLEVLGGRSSRPESPSSNPPDAQVDGSQAEDGSQSVRPLRSRYPVSAEASGATGFVDQTPNAGQSAAPRGLTESTLRATIAERIPSLSRAVDTMLRRGEKGQKGGLVVIASGNELDIAEVFASKTGRDIDDAVQMFSDADGINGFYDPRSGITFLVGPNVTAETAPAVLLHEAIHGQQRQAVDAQALAMLDGRQNTTGRLRSFLDGVAARMDAAGEAGNAQEAAAYIVEEAMMSGRQAGFSAIDGRLMNWIDMNISRRLGLWLRSFVASVRAWSNKLGVPVQLTVDDLVAIAKAGVKQAARGDVVTSGSAKASRAADITQTANFRAWFADSKMRTANGKPITFMHGSPAAFEAFDNSRLGEASGHGTAGLGHFFTRNTSVARKYADGGQIYRGWLRMQNPYVMQLDEAQAIDGPEAAAKRRAELQRLGADGVVMLDDNGNPWAFVVFEPWQFKSQDNRGTFDDFDNRFRFSRGASQQPQQQPQQQPAAPQAVFASPALPQSKLGRAFDRLIYTLQDRFIDLKEIQKAIIASGRTVRDIFNPYQAETLMHGTAAYRNQQFIEGELQPLVKMMREHSVKRETFETYLHARHAKERNAAMAKINPSAAELDQMRLDAEVALKAAEASLQAAPNDSRLQREAADARAKLMHLRAAKPWSGTEEDRLSLSGMTDAEADAILATETPLLKRMGEMVDAITTRTREEMLAYGLETAETVAAMESAYQHYVPLKRDMEESDLLDSLGGTGRGFSIRGTTIQRATGSNREVENILANLVAAREQVIVRGEKNRMAKAMYGLVLEHPNPELYTAIRPGMPEKVLRDELTAMGLDPVLIDGMVKAPAEPRINPNTGLVERRVDPRYAALDNAMVVRVQGEDRVILFNKKSDRAVRLVRALRNDDAEGGGSRWIMEYIGPITRYLASINTQYNPIFGLTNFARDIQGAMLNLTTTELNGKQAALAKTVPSSIRGIWNWERGDKSHPWAKIYEEFLAAGGATGYRDQFANIEDRAKAIEREIGQTGIRNAKGVKETLDLLSDYNTTIENSIRLAAYKQARDAGLSQAKAASLAKDITVNFNRKGARSSFMASLFAFFNSAVQGTERTARVLTGPAGRKLIAAGVALGSLNTLMMMAMLGDDWDKISEFEKAKHIFFPAPWKESGYIKIPMPLGFHAIPNIGRTMTEMAVYRNRLGERTVDMLTTTLDAFNPLGSGSLLAMALPSVLDPAVELAANQNSFGRSIYKEDISSLDPTPGYTRARDGTSGVWVEMARWINAITGGDEYEPGLWSPAPEVLTYAFGVAGGGLLREVEKIWAAGEAGVIGETLPPHRWPILGRFYGEAAGDDTVRRAYSDAQKVVNIAENRMKGMYEAGETPDSATVDLGLMARLMRKDKAYISDLAKMRAQTTDADRKKELDMEILEIQQRFVQSVREIEVGE